MGLREGVFAQRLLMSLMGEVVNEHLLKAGRAGATDDTPPLQVHRSGDDLFVGDRKLSVSIVTASPVSLLLHAGINMTPRAPRCRPWASKSWESFPDQWVPEVLERFAKEWEGIHWACAKVRPVV